MATLGETLSTATIRETLTAARTYYVSTTGNDSNTGLTAGSPFLTIQKAVDTIAALDINAKTTTIQVADGTYTGAVSLKNVAGYAAVGNLVINGNSSTPANVVISTTSAHCFQASGTNTVWLIQNMKLQTTTSGNCLYAIYSGTIAFSLLEFGACAGAHIRAELNGSVLRNGTGTYVISGNAANHMLAYVGGLIYMSAGTVTVSGTPAISSSFAAAQVNGTIRADGITYSGTATGTSYSVTLNGVIYTGGGGGNYFPGNVAGSTATGGQYV